MLHMNVELGEDSSLSWESEVLNKCSPVIAARPWVNLQQQTFLCPELYKSTPFDDLLKSWSSSGHSQSSPQPWLVMPDWTLLTSCDEHVVHRCPTCLTSSILARLFSPHPLPDAMPSGQHLAAKFFPSKTCLTSLFLPFLVLYPSDLGWLTLKTSSGLSLLPISTLILSYCPGNSLSVLFSLSLRCGSANRQQENGAPGTPQAA